MKNTKTLCLAAAMLISFQSWGASSGIKSDHDNECYIWLCLPAGFPSPVCTEPLKAFIKRVTDVSGRPPTRNYTDLPSFSLCIEKHESEDEIFEKAATMGITKPEMAEMTHTTQIYALIPAHQICTFIEDVCTVENNVRVCRKKCTRFESVPAAKMYDTRCQKGAYIYDDFKQIIGSKAVPAYCTKTMNVTTEYADGELYGEPYEMELPD